MTSTNIQDYDPMELMFGVVYDCCEAGRHPEDGEPLTAEAYYVQAEASNGVRFRRYIGTADWKIDEDDEGYPICYPQNYAGDDHREYAGKLDELAGALAAALELSTTRRLNPDVWHYAGACYGSVAYQRLGIEEEVALEEREAERWG